VQILNSNGCTVTSSPATITVWADFLPGSITSAATTICSEATAPEIKSAATASGGNGAYTYEWRYQFNNGTAATITGATGIAYTPPTASSFTDAGSYTFTRWVKDSKCSSYTQSAGSMVLTVRTLPVDLSLSPTTVCSGQTFTLTAMASDSTGTLWYSLTGSDWKEVNIFESRYIADNGVIFSETASCTEKVLWQTSTTYKKTISAQETYTLYVKDGEGCVATKTQIVDVGATTCP
jgi:hypothetical protein